MCHKRHVFHCSVGVYVRSTAWVCAVQQPLVGVVLPVTHGFIVQNSILGQETVHHALGCTGVLTLYSITGEITSLDSDRYACTVGLECMYVVHVYV